MNATTSSPNDFFIQAVEDNHSASDSDTNIDDDDAAEYYQPISAVDSEDDDHDTVVSHSQLLPNGLIINQAQSGVASLTLNDVGDDVSSVEEEDDEEEEIGEGAGSAIREDESCRNAALMPETATRVMEAMRGISFAGVAPDWLNKKLPDTSQTLSIAAAVTVSI